MAKNTIKVKKYSDVIEEIEAAGTITPGMFLALTSANAVVAHNDAGGVCVPMVALEDELQGGEIDDDYSSGDKVQVWIPYRGDMVYAILLASENVDIGDFLESDGTGKLVAATSGIPIAQAVEASNTTVDVRLIVRIL